MSTIQPVTEWLAQSGENRELFHREYFILSVTEDICEYMNENKISRAQLAKRLGKTKSFVSQLLNGGRNMTIGTLADIAFSLNIQVKVQFRGEQVDDGEWSKNICLSKPSSLNHPATGISDQQPRWSTSKSVIEISYEQVEQVAAA